MGTSARKHTIPLAGETPTRAAIASGFASVNDVIPVANTTARAQLLADLAAPTDGSPAYTPSTSRPLIVWRTDAEVGSEIEVTTDGSTWRRAAAGYEGSDTYGTSSISKIDLAGGVTTDTLLLAFSPWTVPATGRYRVMGEFTTATESNAAGVVILTDGTLTRTKEYHSQGGAVALYQRLEFFRSYGAGSVIGVGLRVQPGGGSAGSSHYSPRIQIDRVS